MIYKATFLGLFLLSALSGICQLKTSINGQLPDMKTFEKIKKYQVWATTKDNQIRNGLLYQVENSKIILIPKSSSNYKVFLRKVNTEQEAIDFSMIQTLKIRNQKSVQKGALIGTCLGLGAALGFGATAGGFDFNSEYAGIGMLFMGGITLGGTLIGSLVGLSKKKYRINEKDALEALKKKGIRYSYN